MESGRYDFVAGAATNGILNSMLYTGVPIAFGVLTTDTIEQAVERAGTRTGNLLRQIPG